MPDALSFQVLGPLEVRRPNGDAIDLGGPMPRLVLARLVMADGRIVPADALLETLWGPEPPERAGATLQTYISRLRRALGPTDSRRLRFEASGYRLDVAAEQVDARQFERLADEGSRLLAAGDAAGAAAVLADALALWHGDVLGDADADFVRAAAARLGERRLAATEDLYDAELRRGRAAAVVADLYEEVGHSPLRERMRALLALALYRSGRQADALSVLDEGRRILRDELGLEPSRELRALQSRILDQDPGLDLDLPAEPAPSPVGATDPPSADAAARDSPGPATHREQQRGAPQTDPLIGREAERAAVAAAVAEALSGGGCRYVVIEGEPGIGKTRLAQEALQLVAATGAASLSAGTLESGAAPAYGPWLQLFRTADHQPASLPDAAGLFLDGTGQMLAGPAPSVVAAAVADSVAETVTTLAGDHGLVILLEDLQWADPASLDLLSGLGPRIGAAPVLIVTTVRALEVGRDDAVVEALAQITRQPGTRRISLRGLTPAESGELLARTTGTPMPPEVVSAVHARSEGNPFFTTELARMIGEQGVRGAAAVRAAAVPNGVRDVLRRRVSRLPPATGRLLEVAAVLGRQVDVELLAAVADRPLDECLDDLDPALLHRLLEIPPTAPGAVRFTHALVREALSEGLSSLRRARLHLRAADGLLAAVGENDDTAEIIADHLWHAAAVGASGRAAQALERAAQVALKRQALVSAESLLERAGSLYRAAGEQGALAELRVLRQLGFVNAALHGYAVNADSTLIRRARELAQSTDRPDILLDVIWADWAGCDTGGRPDRAERLVQEAEALIADIDDPLLQAGVASMRGFSERHFGRMQSSKQHIERAIQKFTEAGEAREAGFYLNGFLTSRGYRYWAKAMTEGLDRAGLEHEYLAQDLPFGRMVISLFGAAASLAVGDRDDLRVFAERMTAADPDMLLSFWSASAELYTAVSLLQRKDLDAGMALLTLGQEHMRQGGGRTMLSGIYAAAAQALVEAGALDAARRLLVEARTELATAWELAYRPFVELAAAHLAAAEGDHEAAEQAIRLAAAVATEHESYGALARIENEAAQLRNRQRAG
ncbi:BTAD domain-containing putative transcriptional regulator [Nakamurella sp. GG22]